MEKKSIKQKGYTLLFSVLVSSLVLAVGISILTISKKEFLLTAAARDSTQAIYGADSGVECALYGDFNTSAFDTTADNTAQLVCDSNGAVPNFFSKPSFGTANSGAFTFHARFGSLGTSCAVVTVTKSLVSTFPHTDILSSGYNVGWDTHTNTCSLTSARRVERALHYSY